MAFKIIISPHAKASYLDNIDYLEKEWGIEEIDYFVTKVEQVLEIIKTDPYTFRKFEFSQNVHVVPTVRQINMFYSVMKDEFEVVLFWNNFQDPEKLIKFL